MKAFIFDLNGTMIHDMDYHTRAWQHLLNHELGGRFTRAEVKQQMYGKNEEVLVRLFGPGRFTAAEMQRLQLKSIRCTTIAYEDRKDEAVENWAKEVARIISTRDQMAITASDVTRLSLNALPGAHYRQMWSLCAYVRGKCGTGKGAENPFLQLLTATAAGESSEVALKRILKLSDPTLTPAWRAWAVAQK